MKKAIAIILTLCILGAAGYFGWQAYQKYVAQPADSGSATLVTPYTITRGNLSKTVTGTGTLSISQTENVSLDYGVTVTETLVEEALRLLKGRQKPRVLDMCTGSGCILTSILLEVPDASGTGADLSEKALKVAACNARRLQTADRAEFVKSDLFSSEYFSGSVYDVLISNPPYIPTEEIEGLMEEVRLHDPRMALDGKADGLYFYRAITKQAMDYMLPGGWLLYEIGWDQGRAVKELLDKEGFINTEIKKDLCGLDRVVLGQKSLQEEQNV